MIIYQYGRNMFESEERIEREDTLQVLKALEVCLARFGDIPELKEEADRRMKAIQEKFDIQYETGHIPEEEAVQILHSFNLTSGGYLVVVLPAKQRNKSK